MKGKVLENISMGQTFSTYMASAEGVLRNAGMWKDETWKLMGMTGMAFHFIIHEQICPSSVTVYDWLQEHFTMMDRIGVYSESYQSFGSPETNTFSSFHKEAVKRVKESIDEGKGVVTWAPTPILEFGIIKGYDDNDGIFFVDGCSLTGEIDPLLYENLGKSEIPILFYQLFRDKIDVPVEKVIRDSLRFAVNEWDKEFHINPSYASGRKAYKYLINTLEKEDFDAFGLSYILMVYNDSKNCIHKYLDFISREEGSFDGLEEAAVGYGEISQKFSEMAKLVPFQGSRKTDVDKKNVLPELLELVKECSSIEGRAMDIVTRYVKE